MTALARVEGASAIQGLWLRRLLMAAVSAALAQGPARIAGRQGFRTVCISPRLQWPEKKKNLRFCDIS
jgi:hypothetical protein